MRAILSIALIVVVFVSVDIAVGEETSDLYQVGFAKIDVTPNYPVRLNGFGNRREESEGVSQRIFARAMAISQGDDFPLVVVAIDNLGVRIGHVDQVARRLSRSHDLPRENFSLTFTHSHCAPKVTGASDNIFSEAIPAAHQQHINQYTVDLVDAITAAATRAIDSRQPSTIQWAIGSADFAKNRRLPGGPVDHDLPTLIVRDAKTEAIRGVYVSYACHCVTLRFNRISGDWAGYAAEMVERQFPGSIALVSIGAGSDQNPTEVSPRDVQVALQQGSQIADEVSRLAGEPPKRIHGKPLATIHRIALPLSELPTREQLLEIAENGSRPTDRYNAVTQIARLDAGDVLLAEIDYPIQTWSFGDQLCITFLAGEVCVDYSLRLKREFDRNRFWLNAYSNDFCSYIPSERLVGEGGYGGGAEVPYFALPAKLAAGLEKRIIDEVHRQVPSSFVVAENLGEKTSAGLSSPIRDSVVSDGTSDDTDPPVVPRGVQGIAPMSPEQSLECMRTHDELRVTIAAAEPLVRDPVAIEFGIDGCLWVAEMPDYGRGVYEKFRQTGRIRCLRDSDGDGRLDSATTFLDGLRFPTDVKVWRDGLLICDAPDILMARDTDGDGRADQTETIFSGFEVRNAQARVNSLRWGLDNWIHGSCGLFGGEILSHKTGQTTKLVGRDFRMNPDSGEIEAVSGRTQQGRCRNDWGDWFGCSNGTLLRHYADNEYYQRRNPWVAVPATKGITGSADAHRMYPPSNLVRFALSGAPGVATAACGIGIYRDVSLGESYLGNAFTCEPVNQLVHQIKLSRDGLAFRAERGEQEAKSEFLTSTDQWFRPVQARTGPDGGLWIVDMYRYVIEHSRWIPQSTLAELDVFAGRRLGRIYRVVPRAGKAGRASGDQEPGGQGPGDQGAGDQGAGDQGAAAPTDFSALSSTQLAQMLLSENGVRRDLTHQLLVWRRAADAIPAVTAIANNAPLARSRIQAVAVLDALQGLKPDTLLTALRDEHAEVVRDAVARSEFLLDESDPVRHAVLGLASHSSPRVRRQVAWSLGETGHPEAVGVLAAVASKTETVAGVRSAVLSSIKLENAGAVLRSYLSLPLSEQALPILRQMVSSSIRLSGIDDLEEALGLVMARDTSDVESTFLLLAELLDAADARVGDAGIEFSPTLRAEVQQLHAVALNQLTSASFVLLGRYRGRATQALLRSEQQSRTTKQDVIDALGSKVTARQPLAVQIAAIEALARTREQDAAALLLDQYRRVSLEAQSIIIDAMLRRREWASQLLDRIAEGKLRRGVVGADRRAKLLAYADESICRRAMEVFSASDSPSRVAVVAAYQPAIELTGDVGRGRLLFQKHCSACHQLDGEGHVVGPDLKALTHRDPKWLLTAILDPNRDVDARYVSWSALADDGRLITGLVVQETASTIRLRESGGREHELLRGEVEQFRASDLSLMPEGMEKEMDPQQVSDLIAYVFAATEVVRAPLGDQPLPRYPPQIAPFLLDEGQSSQRRQSVIDQRPGMGPAIVGQLVNGFRAGDLEAQYKRMPWIWRVALAVGRRNDGGEIRDLLEQSLPSGEGPLEHWQVVVVGGGIINALTQVGEWPGERIAGILDGAPSLRPRWDRMLALAATMADDPDVRPGTRYDALRIIAMSAPATAVPHLKKYLVHDVDRQLQMGAVSGLADIRAAGVPAALIEGLSFLKQRNRHLALLGLLRSEQRYKVLRLALTKRHDLIRPSELEPILKHSNKTISGNAARLMSDL